MKKFAKILIVMLAICLTIGVLALVVSAAEGTEPEHIVFPGIKESFVVNGEGYDSLQQAVEAAEESGSTVYVNKDANAVQYTGASSTTYQIKRKGDVGSGKVNWKGSEPYITVSGSVGCNVTADVTIDLNGYTLTAASQIKTSLFYVTSGTLTLTGSGEIHDVRTAFNINGADAALNIDATGSGIKILNKGNASGYAYPIFVGENRSTMNISGYVEVTPERSSTMIFRLMGPTYNAIDGAESVTFDAAKFVVNPATDVGTPNANDLNSMFYLKDGTDIIVKNGSHLEIDTKMFWMPTQKTGAAVDITSYMEANSTPKADADFSAIKMPKATINITVSDSSLVVKGDKRVTTQSNNGTIFQLDNARVHATFTNAYLMGGSRSFIGSSNGASWNPTTKKINENQFVFTNCVFERSPIYNVSSSALFYAGMNVKWVGGAIDNYDSINNRTPNTSVSGYQYQEVTDGFFGISIEDCLYNGNLPEVPASVTTNTWVNMFSTSAKVTEKPFALKAGKAVNYAYYLGEGDFVKLEKAFDGTGMTVDYIKETASSTNVGTNDFASVITVYNAAGRVEEFIDESGNGFLKVTYNASNLSGNQYLQINSGNSSYSFDKYNRFITEFDVSAVGGKFPAYLPFTYQGRITNPRYDKEGTLLGGESAYSPSGVPQLRFCNGGDVYLGTTDTGIDVPADGSWTRVSYVIEVDIDDEIVEKQVQAYTYDASTKKYTADGDNLTATKIQLRKVTARLHYYINGKHLVTADIMPESYGYGGYVAVGYENKLFAEALRVQCPGTAGTGFGLDNVRVSAWKTEENKDLGVSVDGVAVESVVGNPNFLVMPDNKGIAGTVDGVEYKTAEELAAAIKEGSVVILYNDCTETLSVDKSFVLKYGENKIGSVISATHKPSDNIGTQIIRFTPASDDEKFEATYKAEDFGIDKTYTVVIGTSFPISEDVTSTLNMPFDGAFHKLLGWTDADGNMKLDPSDIVDGKVALIPVYENTKYYYTTQLEGAEPVYYTNEADIAALVENVNKILAENAGKSVAVVLWDNAAVGASIVIPKTSALYFDVNGNKLAIGDQVIAFLGGSATETYVTSSRPEATISGQISLLFGGEYDASADAPYKAHVGTLANEAFEIDGKGENLTVTVAQLYEYFAPAADEYNNVAELSVDGGIYAAINPAMMAFIDLGEKGEANVSIKNMIAALAIPLFNSESAKLTASVEDSALVRVDTESGEPCDDTIVGELSKDSSIEMTATLLSASIAPVEGAVILGEKCQLAYIGKTLPNVTLAEGLVPAYADYTVTVAEAPFHVDGYIDLPENLALVTWYDLDKTTVLGTSYNSVNGVITDGAAYNEQVKLATATDWYEVRFTSWDVPASFKAGDEIAAYPICNTPVADVKCLNANLTVYTYFRINYFLPKNVDIENFEFIGISTDTKGEDLLAIETVEIDGVEYIRASEVPGASDTSINKRYVHFKVDGVAYVYEFEFGVPAYAESVMTGKYTEIEKKLIMNMVRYANETYKLANGIAANADGYDTYEKLMDDNASYLIDYAATESSQAFKDAAKTDTTALAKYLSGATFMLGSSQPRFVFLYKSLDDVKLPVDASGSIGEWPKDNKGVFTQFYYETWDGGSSDHIAYHIGVDGATEAAIANGAWTAGDEVYAMTGDVLICDIIQPISVAVYGANSQVVRGTYSLATYITNLEANGNGDFYNAAMSLYTFALAAQEYGDSTFLG